MRRKTVYFPRVFVPPGEIIAIFPRHRADDVLVSLRNLRKLPTILLKLLKHIAGREENVKCSKPGNFPDNFFPKLLAYREIEI